MPTHQIAVVGAACDARPLEVALRRARLDSVSLLPAAALRSPGMTVDAGLTVFAAPPGANPTLEAEVYTAGHGALHVFWDGTAAQVGPYVAPRHGPCPRCLAHASTTVAPGSHRALVSWASSLAALQAHAIVRGSTDLVGVSWVWRLDRPGLGITAWTPVPGCAAAGCAQP